jgi:nicotinate-nucleotide adenylyltransferase
VAIFGGSFDPVHNGHVGAVRTIVDLLSPTQVRIIPSGWSWQKKPFGAAAEHRIAMLLLAFKQLAHESGKKLALVIDQQEINRAKVGMPSYSVDTLIHLRNEFGPDASLVMIIGADQLLQLQSWKNWKTLFSLAHIAVVTRPGFDLKDIAPEVGDEFRQRAAAVEQLRNLAFGNTLLCTELAIEMSSTQVRQGQALAKMPPGVADYIRRHHLY